MTLSKITLSTRCKHWLLMFCLEKKYLFSAAGNKFLHFWNKGPWPNALQWSGLFCPFLMQWQLLEPCTTSGNLRATPFSGFFQLQILELSRQTGKREIILNHLNIRWKCKFWGSCGIFGCDVSDIFCQQICRFSSINCATWTPPARCLNGERRLATWAATWNHMWDCWKNREPRT